MRYRSHSDEIPIFGSCESLFTCAIHHGGTVYTENRKFGYTGHKEDYFDNVDPDEISLLEFETMAEQLGYSKKMPVWCRVYGENINPKLLISDKDLMAMIDKLPKNNRVLECYLDDECSEEQMDTNNKAAKEVIEEADASDLNQEAEDVEVDEDVASDFYDPNNDVEADDNDIAPSDIMKRNDVAFDKSEMNYAPFNEEEESNYAPSDVLISADESDGDDTSQRYPEFNASVDMANPHFKVGMIFASFEEFKCAVKEYAIKQRRNVHFERNDTKRVKAVCKEGCPWNVWVSRMGSAIENVQVKTYNPSHTCSNEHNIKFLTVKWLVKKYLGTFRADPSWSIPGIQARIRTDLHLDISRQKAWSVKADALKIIVGNEGEQYSKLPCYAAEIRRTNPNSTVIYDLRNKVFKRAYFCFAACKAGFLAGCRPIISLDGCWLKGRYGGQLLSAVAIDANDCIFPVAYAVVEGENSESWRWFLQLLGNDLVMENSHSWTFMSDRQKVC